MWFLTIDPFVGIPVFIAKLSKRQYWRRVFEDFHNQEYIQFLDIHCGLFMRLHFSIDYRTTTRLRQSIHFNFTQVLFADDMCIDTPESTTNSLSSGFNVGAGRHLLSGDEKSAALSCSFNLNTSSTLLRGHLTLATLSLRVNDPQILEHWGYAHEVHLDKCNLEKDFGLEF